MTQPLNPNQGDGAIVQDQDIFEPELIPQLNAEPFLHPTSFADEGAARLSDYYLYHGSLSGHKVFESHYDTLFKQKEMKPHLEKIFILPYNSQKGAYEYEPIRPIIDYYQRLNHSTALYIEGLQVLADVFNQNDANHPSYDLYIIDNTQKRTVTLEWVHRETQTVFLSLTNPRAARAIVILLDTLKAQGHVFFSTEHGIAIQYPDGTHSDSFAHFDLLTDACLSWNLDLSQRIRVAYKDFFESTNTTFYEKEGQFVIKEAGPIAYDTDATSPIFTFNTLLELDSFLKEVIKLRALAAEYGFILVVDFKINQFVIRPPTRGFFNYQFPNLQSLQKFLHDPKAIDLHKQRVIVYALRLLLDDSELRKTFQSFKQLSLNQTMDLVISAFSGLEILYDFFLKNNLLDWPSALPRPTTPLKNLEAKFEFYREFYNFKPEFIQTDGVFNWQLTIQLKTNPDLCLKFRSPHELKLFLIAYQFLSPDELKSLWTNEDIFTLDKLDEIISNKDNQNQKPPDDPEDPSASAPLTEGSAPDTALIEPNNKDESILTDSYIMGAHLLLSATPFEMRLPSWDRPALKFFSYSLSAPFPHFATFNLLSDSIQVPKSDEVHPLKLIEEKSIKTNSSPRYFGTLKPMATRMGEGLAVGAAFGAFDVGADGVLKQETQDQMMLGAGVLMLGLGLYHEPWEAIHMLPGFVVGENLSHKAQAATELWAQSDFDESLEKAAYLELSDEDWSTFIRHASLGLGQEVGSGLSKHLLFPMFVKFLRHPQVLAPLALAALPVFPFFSAAKEENLNRQAKAKSVLKKMEALKLLEAFHKEFMRLKKACPQIIHKDYENLLLDLFEMDMSFKEGGEEAYMDCMNKILDRYLEELTWRGYEASYKKALIPLLTSTSDLLRIEVGAIHELPLLKTTGVRRHKIAPVNRSV